MGRFIKYFPSEEFFKRKQIIMKKYNKATKKNMFITLQF